MGEMVRFTLTKIHGPNGVVLKARQLAFPLRGRWREAPDEVLNPSEGKIYTSSVKH